MPTEHPRDRARSEPAGPAAPEARARITLADVAARAGVSRATASLVARDSDLVADRTRRAVLDAMNELGYVYHRGAASLRKRRSGAIAVVVADLINPFQAELAMGFEAELRPSGEITLLSRTFDDLDRQAMLLTTMLEYQIDGVLLVPATGTRDEDLSVLASRGIPYVLVNRYIGMPGANYVGMREDAAGRTAAAHLLEHGCATLAYFGGLAVATARRDRFEGFRAAVAGSAARVDESWCAPTPNTAVGSHEVAARLLAEGGELPDGVLCHSDAVAFGLMRALRETGRSAPRDMRIVGGADVEVAAMWEPPLTSISVRAEDMGRAAATLLRRVIAGEAPDGPYLFEPDLVVRESCGCHSGHREHLDGAAAQEL
ncbi:MAG TPA: LacI family DNA-binding transcriptional regulator [Spirillospora sp.]|nr:LacI family DNA-binding transcriptional regulator [Spirillospora sp.]